MPYDTLDDLPESVRNTLPKHAQEICRAAFSLVWDTYQDPSERKGGASREGKPRTKELRHDLGDRCHFICTDSKAPGYEHRCIDAAYMRETLDDFGQHFYLCGPPGFMDAVTESLKGLGADPQALVFEQ